MLWLARFLKAAWWMCLGGRFHDARVQCLSQDIIGNRKRISELRQRIIALENQQWLNAEHSPAETQQRIREGLTILRQEIQALRT